MAAEVLDTAPQASHEVQPEVHVVRSARRRRTISAYRSGSRIVVQVPARPTRAEEAQWGARLARRGLAGEGGLLRRADDLMVRAGDLPRRFLDGRAEPAAV